MIHLQNTTLDTLYMAAIWGRRIWRYVIRPTEVGVRTLVLRGDTVLLVRHRWGKTPWSLPGGGIKAHESFATAAHREVYEEARCTIQIERLHGIFHTTGRGLNVYTLVFVCTALSDAHPPIGDIEIADARFVSLHTPSVDIEAGSRRRLHEYLAGKSGLADTW